MEGSNEVCPASLPDLYMFRTHPSVRHTYLSSFLPSTSTPLEAVYHPLPEASDRPLGQLYSRIPPSLHHLILSFVIPSSFLSYDHDLSRLNDLMILDSYLELFPSSRCPTFVPVSPSRAHLSSFNS